MQAGSGLKNWLRDFFFIFAYMFMVFRVYSCEKKPKHTSPWMYLNGCYLKINVQKSFFCMEYMAGNATFRTQFRLKKTTREFKKKKINVICMGIVFILVRKNGGHRCYIEEGLSQTLKMCQWSKIFRKWIYYKQKLKLRRTDAQSLPARASLKGRLRLSPEFFYTYTRHH